jgi:hypothetical protein
MIEASIVGLEAAIFLPFLPIPDTTDCVTTICWGATVSGGVRVDVRSVKCANGSIPVLIFDGATVDKVVKETIHPGSPTFEFLDVHCALGRALGISGACGGGGWVGDVATSKVRVLELHLRIVLDGIATSRFNLAGVA